MRPYKQIALPPAFQAAVGKMYTVGSAADATDLAADAVTDPGVADMTDPDVAAAIDPVADDLSSLALPDQTVTADNLRLRTSPAILVVDRIGDAIVVLSQPSAAAAYLDSAPADLELLVA